MTFDLGLFDPGAPIDPVKSYPARGFTMEYSRVAGQLPPPVSERRPAQARGHTNTQLRSISGLPHADMTPRALPCQLLQPRFAIGRHAEVG